jgi:hypothetical protein
MEREEEAKRLHSNREEGKEADIEELRSTAMHLLFMVRFLGRGSSPTRRTSSPRLHALRNENSGG